MFGKFNFFKEKANTEEKSKTEDKMEKNKRTKEEAQTELIERFGLRKTSDFQASLRKGDIELAEKWLNYIEDNRADFPQYEATWDSWLSDRQGEIELYSKLKDDGDLEKIDLSQTKETAQARLVEKFGDDKLEMRKTSDFRKALEEGKIELAEAWLNYVVENKMSFPQYLSTWDSWLSDRQEELAEAKK